MKTGGEELPISMAVASAVSAERTNALLDAGSNLCYTDINVEQDYNFIGDECHAVYGTNKFRLAILHSFQRAGAKSLQAGVLRQQNVLRDFN